MRRPSWAGYWPPRSTRATVRTTWRPRPRRGSSLTAFSAVFLVLWLAAVASYVLSAYCLGSFLSRNRPKPGPPHEPGALPPVTVLKPIRGKDENTYSNLKSFIEQEYPVCQ